MGYFLFSPGTHPGHYSISASQHYAPVWLQIRTTVFVFAGIGNNWNTNSSTNFPRMAAGSTRKPFDALPSGFSAPALLADLHYTPFFAPAATLGQRCAGNPRNSIFDGQKQRCILAHIPGIYLHSPMDVVRPAVYIFFRLPALPHGGTMDTSAPVDRPGMLRRSLYTHDHE
jgi:hypothetical protein